MSGLLKGYYVAECAFYTQQILVVNMEERRKDFHQMLTHHIITSGLIFASYGHYYNRVGNVILCLMDVGDVILPVSYISFLFSLDWDFEKFKSRLLTFGFSLPKCSNISIISSRATLHLPFS